MEGLENHWVTPCDWGNRGLGQGVADLLQGELKWTKVVSVTSLLLESSPLHGCWFIVVPYLLPFSPPLDSIPSFHPLSFPGPSSDRFFVPPYKVASEGAPGLQVPGLPLCWSSHNKATQNLPKPKVPLVISSLVASLPSSLLRAGRAASLVGAHVALPECSLRQERFWIWGQLEAVWNPGWTFPG